MDSYRTFVAIELPRELRTSVIEHINTLRREVPDVRASWLREENLHLTLKFLGNVSIKHIADVSAAVARATHLIEAFDLILSGCGAFPPRGKPNVLWIGVESRTSSLLDLHNLIERELATIGFAAEQRSFHPHLTIARLRNRHGRQLSEFHQRLGFAPQPFHVSEVEVFRSELLRDGSRHTAISRHELSKINRQTERV